MSDAPSSTIDLSQEERTSIIITSTPDSFSSPHSAMSAEVSVPSVRSDLQLMSMPGEVRHQIWKHVVTKPRGDIAISFSYEHHMGHEALKLQLDRRWGKLNRGYKSLQLGVFATLALHEGSRISILLTCRQIHSEAIYILYGENRFVSYNLHGFCDFFVGDPVHGIGEKHAATIKSVTLDVPACRDREHRQGYRNNLCKLTSLVCKTLCGLHDAKLAICFLACKPLTGLVSPSWGVPGQQWAYERNRLLSAASFVTESHPILKKAIWSSSSGGKDVLTSTGAYFWVEFVVNLFSEGSHALTTGKRCDADGQFVGTRVKTFVLQDTNPDHSTGYRTRLSQDPQRYFGQQSPAQ